MVNFIWVAMTIFGIVFGMINGTLAEVNEGIFKGAKEAVAICIGLVSILVFWLGLMKIAEASGMLAALSKLFQPVMRKLFPDVPEDHPANGYILSNMISNVFGLGNAATPLGIKAMQQMKELNGGRDEATRSMITFLAINTSSLTLIPTTVLAIRMNYNSAAPTEIIGPTIIATACSTFAALLIDRFFYYKRIKAGREKR